MSARVKQHKTELTVKAKAFRPIPADVVEAFKSLVSANPDANGCLHWTAGRFQRGYGGFFIPGQGTFKAHRIAYYLHYGQCAPELLVRHLCGNTSCCNALHLAQGTVADNSADAIRHGTVATGDRNGSRTHPESRPRGDNNTSRSRPELLPRGDRHHTKLRPETILRGERSSNARLTEADVREIRRLRASGKEIIPLGKMFGVNHATISKICLRQSWAHIL